METRECKTISDVRNLLADYEVSVELREDATITLQFPFIEKWQKKRYNKHELELVGDGNIDEPSGVNRNRIIRNTIRSLIGSDQFWRCTTVADQITKFKMIDGKKWGLDKITKKAGQPLTLHFSSEITANVFFGALR